MSLDHYFENPFEDYTPENAKLLIVNSQLHADSKIARGVSEKWQNALSELKYLDFNDCSVYTGTSGIALLKLRHDSQTKQHLEEVRQLLSLHRLRKKHYTFLIGDAGPLAIAAVVDHKLGLAGYLEHVQALKSLDTEILDPNSALPNEYLYGRVGYLFAVLYANKNVSPPPFDDSFIRKIIEIILMCGKSEAKAGKFKCPLMYQFYESYSLGAAHGLSGILYLLLQVKEYLTESELATLIKPTVEYLGGLRFASGNFPSSLGRENDKYVQWCHGAPGFVYLFSMAYKVFGDSKYLQLANDCGEVVWTRGLCRKGYSLCHGVAGNAYCFLELYQTTQDEKHLYRAVKFAEWCFDYDKNHVGHPPDRPHSLYEGLAGPMYLFLDIQRPLSAKFPGFSL